MDLDLQRAAGQGEAKTQQNPQPQAPPKAPGGAEGAPVGFGVCFRIALASRALPVHAGWGLGYIILLDAARGGRAICRPRTWAAQVPPRAAA